KVVHIVKDFHVASGRRTRMERLLCHHHLTLTKISGRYITFTFYEVHLCRVRIHGWCNTRSKNTRNYKRNREDLSSIESFRALRGLSMWSRLRPYFKVFPAQQQVDHRMALTGPR